MLARDERERLLKSVAELYVGDDGDLDTAWAEQQMTTRVGADDGLLSSEDELLVEEVREVLVLILSATRARQPTAAVPQSAILGILGGAELVLRWELIAGRSDRLPELLVSFTYLAALFMVGREEAMRHSKMTQQVIDSRLGRPGI